MGLSDKIKASIRQAAHPANEPEAQQARAAGQDHRAITMRDDNGNITSWMSCLCRIGSEHDA
jgi:hypothetical protein